MSDNARITTQAVELGIKSLTAYAAQIEEFKKKTIACVQQLGQTHRDQNYKKFYDYFTPKWQTMDKFKKEMEEFRDYLEKHKKIIIEYEQINAPKE